MQVLTVFLPAMISTWIITRLHAPDHAAALGLAATLGIPLTLLPRLLFLLGNIREHGRFTPYLVGYLDALPRLVLFMLLGALTGCALAQRAARARRVSHP